jgi:hypothetical protein
VTDNPFVKPPAVVEPQRDQRGRMTIVVLDRVEPGVEPPYCTHGKVTCYGPCGEWLWLGSESYKLVRSGEVAGICQPCAAAWFDKLGWRRPKPARNVNDHRREDGPHA